MLPAEPPAQRIEAGSRLKSSVRSFSDWYFEFAGTTIPSVSVIIVAIGVVRSSATSDPFVSIAPSITSPVIISWYGSPEDFETSCESPSVPPAPSTLKTSTPSSSFASRDAAWNARAVVSQPPPGAAGAMIEICRVGYGCDASSPPDAPPGATIATTAATASTAPMTAREFSRFPTRDVQYPLSCRAVHRIFVAALILLVAGCGGGNSEPPEETAVTHARADANRLRAGHAAGAQDTRARAPTEELDPAKTYVATVKTNCGDFEITLDAERRAEDQRVVQVARRPEVLRRRRRSTGSCPAS